MTRADHPSGTDRLAEVAASLDCDVIVNVQGDEPLLEPGHDRRGRRPVRGDPGVMMTHAAPAHRRPPRRANPNVVEGRRRSRRRSRCTFRARRSRSCATAPPAFAAGCLAPRRALRLPPRRACCGWRRCRRRRSSGPNRWSSCARSNTASASGASRRRYDSIGVDTPDDLERVRGRSSAGRALPPHYGMASMTHTDSPAAQSSTSSSPAAWSRRSARDSPPPPSARCSRATATGSTLQKFDPYINVDPGTMSPYQHGEVYVTDDGAETDLDLGHYERFTNAGDHAEPQLDDRQDLPVGDPEGAARRLPGRDRAGHPAHHQRDQGQHPRRRRATSTSSSSRSAARSATSRACRSSRRSASSARTSAARTRSTST